MGHPWLTRGAGMTGRVFDCGDPAVDGWLRLDAVAADRPVGEVVQVATERGRVVGGIGWVRVHTGAV